MRNTKIMRRWNRLEIKGQTSAENMTHIVTLSLIQSRDWVFVQLANRKCLEATWQGRGVGVCTEPMQECESGFKERF